MNRIISIVFFIIWLLEGTLARGAEGVGDFQFVSLGIEDGLSNNSVTAFYQDKKGFMWVGTFDGLNRYDGYDFLIFRNQPDDPSTLISNRIVSISGNEREIWIGTKDGLCIYNYLTGSFAPGFYRETEAKEKVGIRCPVNKVKEADGVVYIATAGKGLMYDSGRGGLCKRVPLWIDGKQHWDYHAQGIDFDKAGNMWVFVQGIGICHGKTDHPELKVIFSDLKSGHCLTLDDEANIWVGLDNGLLRYDLKDTGYFIFSHTEVRYQVEDIIYLSDRQQIWAASDGNGVICYDLNKLEFIQYERWHEELRACKSVYALYQDQEGRGWLGTLRDGVHVVVNQSPLFKTVARDNGTEATLPGNYILSLCEKGGGWDRVWIGTDGFGVCEWNYRHNTFRNLKHNPYDSSSLPNDYVTTIEKTWKGFWFGTYGGGVALLDEATGKFKSYSLYNTKENYEQKYVWVLFRDAANSLWVGSSCDRGLYRYNPDVDKFEYIDVDVENVISISQDQQNNLWVGTFNSLVRVDKKSLHTKRFGMDNPVRSICFRNKNCLLIGTEGGGLVIFNPESGEKRRLIESNGLCNNSVLNIVEDNLGFYWLSTYNGISKFDFRTEKFVNYYAEDGLQSNQFNYNAALKIKDGRIVMGGIRGLNLINPVVRPETAKFPRLAITKIQVNNIPVERTGQTAPTIQKLKLSADQSMLSIGFVGMEYARPGKIVYAYRLEGWDSEWHYSRELREANYSKLTEGDYIFKLKSTNADGVWSEQALELPVVILPPWYRTFWAYLLYVVLISFIGWVIYSYLKKQKQLEYEVCLSKDRMRQEKELNEKKFTFFTMITYEFRAPLTRIIDPLKRVIFGGKIEPESMEQAYRSSRRLLNLVDQLLLFQQVENEDGTLRIIELDIVELCREVVSCFAQQAGQKEIDYQFYSDVKSCLIYADRQKLELCLFDVISNAMKFTDKRGKVGIKFRVEKEEVVISVSDNGPGIAEQEKDRIFELFYQGNACGRLPQKTGFGIGLYIVRKFVLWHHGSVRCLDNGDQGVIFEIRLKRGKKHFAGQEILEGQECGKMYPEILPEEPYLTEIGGEELSVRLPENQKNRREILIVGEGQQMIAYIKKMLSEFYSVRTAQGIEGALAEVRKKRPDMIIADVLLENSNGIDLCRLIRQNEGNGHIPIVLLTSSVSEEVKLKGIEAGADDYMTKPFEWEDFLERVAGIFRRDVKAQEQLQDVMVLDLPDLSDQDKEFVDQFIENIEDVDEDFNVKVLARKMGMSNSLLYKRIRQLTGMSVVEFVRIIRLRKGAMMLVSTDLQVSEVALRIGFNDMKYFRKLFCQRYNMSPSAFQKKYKNAKSDIQKSVAK